MLNKIILASKSKVRKEILDKHNIWSYIWNENGFWGFKMEFILNCEIISWQSLRCHDLLLVHIGHKIHTSITPHTILGGCHQIAWNHWVTRRSLKLISWLFNKVLNAFVESPTRTIECPYLHRLSHYRLWSQYYELHLITWHAAMSVNSNFPGF